MSNAGSTWVVFVHCKISYIGKMVNLFENSPKLPQFGFVGTIATIVLFLLLVAGLLVAVHYLVTTFWCSKKPSNSFEAFEDEAKDPKAKDPVKEITDRTAELTSLQDQIDTDLQALDDAADSTCEITKQIEDSYVSNAAAPTDEAEYQMPPDVQKDRQTKRNQRSKTRFQTEKKRYSAVKGTTPVYECFADAEAQDTIVAAESDLRSTMDDITRVMDTAEMKAAAAKGSALQSLLGFNAGYLKKGVSTITEGFADALTGKALLDAADALITKGKDLHTAVVNITAAVKQQQVAAKGVFQKSKDLQDGKVNPDDSAVASSKFKASPS